jgi:hypothetical protein
MNNKILTVKDKKVGKVIDVPELETEELTPEEIENLNYLADPRFFGPDYD